MHKDHVPSLEGGLPISAFLNTFQRNRKTAVGTPNPAYNTQNAIEGVE